MRIDVTFTCLFLVFPLLVSTFKIPGLHKGSNDEGAPNESDLTGWSTSVFDTLLEMANLSKVTYCTVLNPGFTVGLMSESCPKMQFCRDHSDTEIVLITRPSSKEKELSGTAYVAASKKEKKVYAVFRGSISAGDWLTDFIFNQCPYAPVLQNKNIGAQTFSNVTKETSAEAISAIIDENADFKPCENCLVHCGAYVEYSQFIEEVDAAVKPFVDEGYQLYVTGHSLGGSYTYLAGLDFLLAGYNPIVVSLSSFKTGNPEWNVFLDEQFNTEKNFKVVAEGGDLPAPSFTRIYQKTDVVPVIPPSIPGVVEYTHAGLYFVIDKVNLPQGYKDVEFKGMTDNYDNSSHLVYTGDWRSFIGYYQHISTLARMSPPCNDWEIPFRR